MQFNLLENLELIALILGISAPFAGAIIAYFKNKFKCIGELRSEFEEFKDVIEDRQLRHSKAFIILANRIDDINHSQHPERPKLNLGPEIETILKDREGKL